MFTEATVAVLQAQSRHLEQSSQATIESSRLEAAKLEQENRRIALQEKQMAIQEQMSKEDALDRKASREMLLQAQQFQATMMTSFLEMIKRVKD